MKLDRIRLRNFRSYRDSGEVTLSEKTVLIGENNAGKSNVLRALHLYLNLSPTTPHTIDDSFHRNAENIEIEAWFTDLDDEEIDSFDDYVINDELWVKIIFPFDKEGSPETKRILLKTEVPSNQDFKNLHDKSADELVGIYDRHESTLKEYQTDDWGGKYKKYIIPLIKRYLEEGDPETEEKTRENPQGIKKRLKVNLPEFRYFQSDRNIEDETKTTTSAVLGQLLENAIDDVPQGDEDEIIAALNSVDEKLNNEEKFDQIIELEDQLQQKLHQQIPLDDLRINIDIPRLEDILSNVSVTIDDGIETDITTMGSGLHTAFILSCLWELSERDTDSAGVIFGLEEPENDLHPHAQRQLYDTLDDLVDQGYQVILSTHSAHLVSGEEIFDVRRVEKRGKSSKVHLVDEIRFSEEQAEKIQRRMTAEHNEMFFSKALLLCEGQTEEWIVPVFNSLIDSSRQELYAFDRLGITMVSTEGKSGMKPFLRLADCYNIPTIALIDNDAGEDDGHDGMRDEIERLAKTVLELPADSEAELFESTTLDDFCDVMATAVPEYDTTADDLRRWCDGADKPEQEVMAEEFESASPSKPLFGKLLAEKISEDQLSEAFVELMETVREVAIGGTRVSYDEPPVETSTPTQSE